VIVSRRVLVSSRWVLHCLPLACGLRGSLREDEPLSSRSLCVFPSRCRIVCGPVDGLVCVPESGVEWDMQVYIAEEVGIIRNVVDDRRRVGRLSPWQWITLN
jgi:hypothetical protein